MELNVVRRITVEAQARNVDPTTAGLRQLADAQGAVAAASEKQEKATMSLERVLDRQRRAFEQNYRQQQQFNDMVLDQTRASDGLVAANDNLSESYRVLGLELASTANHLLRAGEAAYVFSPAFRQVVNGMAAPALRGASTALIAVAAGMVTATNLAGRGLIELGLAAARSSSALAPVGGAVAMIGAQMAAFNPTVTSVAASLASRLLPALSLFLRFAGPILLVKDAFEAVAKAWELGGQKLDEWRQIAEKAASVDLSTQFFQRITKAASDAKQPVDEITASIKRLGEVTQDKLGGSDFQNHLDKLTKAGNFQGNTGVSQLASANTTEEKFRAIVSLVDQAMAKGERLAALDLTSKFLSPAAQAALAANSDYLKDMLASADAISKADLVSDENIGRALELKNRYDDAVKILETRWHPIQDLLTKGGIEMRAAWVSIVEAVAAGVDWVTKLVMKIGELPQGFWDLAKKGYGAALSTAVGAIPGIGTVVTGARIASQVMSAGDQTSGITPDAIKSVTEYGQAVDKLRAGLQNTNAVQKAVAETNAVQAGVWRDTSKAITEAAKATAEQKNQFDRTVESVEKHIARMNADAKAVGLGAGAQEEFRAKAALTTAAMQAGIPITRQLTDFIDALSKKAGKAGQNLAKVKVDESIRMQRQSIGLSPEDQQIAQQIAHLYNNDIPRALASTEAAELRLINAQKLLADGFRDVGKEMFTAFVTGKNVMDALVQSLDAFAGKLAGAGFDNLISGNPMQMGIGALQLGASALISAFTGDQKAKRALEEAQQRWKDMAGQVDAFNRAAAGVDLGPLTSGLMQLRSTYQQLAMAALEARDYGAISNLQETFNRGVVRTMLQFETASAVSSDLANQMKAVADEGAGLLEFLKQYGLANQGYIDSISASIARQQQELRDTFERGLVADIRSNSGVGYLNTIADAIRKVSEASAAGVNPNVLQAWLISTAQTAVNSAKLTGDAFNDMIAQFPQLTGLVHQFVDAAAEASQKLSLQLRLLTATTDSSTLGGALTLFDAKATQERNAALAAGISMENLALLDQAVAAERLNVVKDFSQRAIDEEKRLADARIGQMQRIQDYLNNLTGGSNSTLSPQGRLDAARSQFATQLGLAQGGDQNALSSITQYSDNFLQASRAYNASSVAFQNDFAYVQSALAGLISLVGGTSTSAITGGTASVGGVSAISSVANVSAANGNSWAGVIDAVNSLKAEVVILKAALKEAVDNNTKAIAIAHTEENDNLEEIVDELKAIHSSNGNLALAGPT